MPENGGGACAVTATDQISFSWCVNRFRPIEALGHFVLWAFDCILTDLVAIFVALAMVLRRKPDALTNVLPTLRENAKYQGHDKLPVTVWMMAQASQGDLSVGLYSWAHNLLPVVVNKNCNPQARDLILHLVENC